MVLGVFRLLNKIILRCSMIKKKTRRLHSYFCYYIFGGVSSARAAGVKVGEGCRIYIKDFGSEPFLISIGDNVTITAGVKLITHDGSLSLVRDAQGRRFYYAPIKISNDVFIGVNSIILPGVTIGREVVVAAGSVVTKDIPSGVVVAGAPAKEIMSFSSWRESKLRFPSEFSLQEFDAGEYIKKVSAAIAQQK